MGVAHGFVFKHGKRIHEQEMWGASRSRGGRRNRFFQRLCRKQYVQQEGLQASDLAGLETGQWPQQQQEREGTNTMTGQGCGENQGFQQWVFTLQLIGKS